MNLNTKPNNDKDGERLEARFDVTVYLYFDGFFYIYIYIYNFTKWNLQGWKFKRWPQYNLKYKEIHYHPSLSNVIDYTHDYDTLNILIMFSMNVTY